MRERLDAESKENDKKSSTKRMQSMRENLDAESKENYKESAMENAIYT